MLLELGRTTAGNRGDWPRRRGSDGQDRRGGWRGWQGDSGPQAAHRFLLLSIDKTSGTLLWERTATEATPHEGFHPNYGSFASHSPVTDGEHVFAYFGSRGVFCFDLDGALVWSKDLGRMTKILGFGEGTPLVLYKDRLIIKFDHEGESFIVALDKATGEELWRAVRDEITSWSPPLVVDHEGRTQVVVAATRKVRSYDLETGEVHMGGRGAWSQPDSSSGSPERPRLCDERVYGPEPDGNPAGGARRSYRYRRHCLEQHTGERLFGVARLYVVRPEWTNERVLQERLFAG